MRVRQIIRQQKLLVSETAWTGSDIPPRHAPIYVRTYPIRAGWKWKSARLTSNGQTLILLALCNPLRDKWQAVLMVEKSQGVSVVCRFEHHGSHPGLHVHSNCERSGMEVGAIGMDNLDRFPQNGRYHRRDVAWTETTFWEAARRFFRLRLNDGPLFEI